LGNYVQDFVKRSKEKKRGRETAMFTSYDGNINKYKLIHLSTVYYS